MKRLFLCAGFLFLVFLLSACQPKKDAPETTVEVPLPVAPSREAVFTYNNQAGNYPARIVLTLPGAPVLVGSVYLKLAGIAAGDHCLALVSAGGKELVLTEGSRWENYQVVAIEDNRIILMQNKEEEE
ncbi:MAG: hypothetical protein WCT39_01005 [Candidatus Margulisiibacteriota bacterium]